MMITIWRPLTGADFEEVNWVPDQPRSEDGPKCQSDGKNTAETRENGGTRTGRRAVGDVS